MAEAFREQDFNKSTEVHLWARVLDFDCSYKDAINLRRTCKQMKEIVETSEDFWLKQLHRRHQCNERCSRSEKIRHTTSNIPTRVSRCLHILGNFVMKWSKFHLWQYIQIRELLDIYDKQIIPKYNRAIERTLLLSGTIDALNTVEEHYTIPPSKAWDKNSMAVAMGVVQGDIKISLQELYSLRKEVAFWLMKLLNSRDDRRYFLIS